MSRKDAIEAEMEAQLSILQSNAVTIDTPLVDSEGFPRADIDVWAVRHARVRIIELRNDLKALMDEMMLYINWQSMHRMYEARRKSALTVR